MKEFTVLGWFGHKNVGDDAYEIALPLIFPDLRFHYTDHLLPSVSGDIILGGGDVLCEHFIRQIRPCEGNKIALSVNYTMRHAGLDVRCFSGIFARNEPPYPGPCTQIPDLTFALKPDPEAGERTLRRLFRDSDAYEKKVAVVFNSFLCVRDDGLARDRAAFSKTCYDLASLADSTNASFLFLPFGNGLPHNDRIANGWLYGHCKYWKKNALVFDELTPQETLDVLSAVDAAVCTRLHASIFSCIGQTPFIDLSHHDKSRLFLQSAGLNDWAFNYWSFNCDQAKELLARFLQDPLPHQERLGRVVTRSRAVLKELPGMIGL